MENAEIQTFQCDILSNFRTMWVSVFALFGQNRTLWTKIPRKNKCIESRNEKVFGPFCVKTRANWLLDVFSHLFFDDQSVCVWPWSHKDKMLFNFYKHVFVESIFSWELQLLLLWYPSVKNDSDKIMVDTTTAMPRFMSEDKCRTSFPWNIISSRPFEYFRLSLVKLFPFWINDIGR